jgi:hypothetical protein
MASGFDRAELDAGDGSTQQLTPAQFRAMALADRVRAILRGHLRFYRNGREIPMKEALED